MFSSKSNKKLGIVLAALVIVVIIMFATDGKNERTFRENLVDIDSSVVSEIIITSKAHGDVKLFKEKDLWKVKLNEKKSVPVPVTKIQSLINQILEIKPKRLAARNENKWKDFQVDSSGTRVVVKENGNTSLDLIIGRFAFQQPRTMSTYVRLQNDVDVYEVDGFLQAAFNQDANSFRDGRLFAEQTNSANWKNLEFTYPADSSFQLIKINGNWRTINNMIDSAKTEQYLRQLSSLTASKFVDYIEPAILSNPIYVLKIQKEEGNPTIINAYQKDDTLIISSSENTYALFNGSENDFWKKIFIGEKSLHAK